MGTRLRLTRSGGIAGIDMVASVDVDDLPPQTASSVRAALAGVGHGRRTAAHGEPPPGADRYQYDLVIDAGGEPRTVRAHDGALTPELQTVVDALLPLAEPA